MRRSAVLALGAVLLLAACSGDDSDGTDAATPATTPPTSTSAATEFEDVTLEFRPVLAVTEPPCAAGAFEDRQGELCYRLGEAVLDEGAVESADAILDPNDGTTWQVAPLFREGPEGIDRFNAATTRCFAADPSCPTQQLAIVLDRVVESAPSITATPTFERDAIIISGDFTQAEAEDLADALSV